MNPDLGIDDQADLLPYDPEYEFPRDRYKHLTLEFNPQDLLLVEKIVR